jgi:hypothetical protein
MMASLATGWRGAGQTRAAQRKEGEGLLARASARGINVVDWEATPPALREELLRAAVDRNGPARHARGGLRRRVRADSRRLQDEVFSHDLGL